MSDINMTESERTLYPEHAKLEKVKDESQTIGLFLEWLLNNGRQICVPHQHDETNCRDENLPWEGYVCGYRENDFVPVRRGIEDWLALYYDIDLKKLNAEKVAMLEVIRAIQTGGK